MHLAESREQAIEDVKFGLNDWCHYTQRILAVPHFRAAGESFEERVAWVNETGLGVIGTPDDAIAQIERLEKQSNGGFGAYLMMDHEWANPRAQERHYELFARYVKPRFQNLSKGTVRAEQRAIGEWDSLGDRVERAVQAATDAHFGANASS
jgi:limonene 1,2-monooxygenase